MKRRFDADNFLWFLILAGLFYYFCRLIGTGDLALFINPRMFKYVYFGAAVLGVMAVYQLFEVFNPEPSRKVKYGYLMFSIPLILGLIVSPKGLNADAVEGRGIEALLKGNVSVFSSSTKKMLNSERKKYIENNEVLIDNANYTRLMEDIYENMDLYKGKSITITGFVYRDNQLSSGEFIAARMLMNCCAADAQVIGFLCRYDNEINLEKGQWVRVRGVIEEHGSMPVSFNNSKIPAIKIGSVEKIDEPLDKYIYP